MATKKAPKKSNKNKGLRKAKKLEPTKPLMVRAGGAPVKY